MEAEWNTLSPEQKRERRFEMWLSPQGIQFVSPEAEAVYKARVTRFRDVIELRKTPDRVPVVPFAGFYPAFYSGYNARDVMYDYEKLVAAWTKFVLDFEPDAYVGAWVPGPGPMFDVLDYKLYNWPGHGVSPDHTYQCLEAEYMKPEEYDALIEDPTDYWLRTYMPRICGALEPFSMLQPLREVVEMAFLGFTMIPFGLPPVQAAFEKFLEAGREAFRWAGVLAQADAAAISAGFPNCAGGASKAPFDVIGDTLRGTRGIMMDMYRCPDKLLEALDRITPLMIKWGVSGANMNRHPIIFIPLHKGADGFMSDEQFRTFYWPSFRKVLIGLIEEGIVPFLFAEGGYNSRLEVIRDLPKGTTVWYFDHTDMARAKEVLGDVACIMGNVPIALMQTGTPEQVNEYCKKLIEVAGKGGGFILANGAVMDQAKPENIRAMVRCAKEYGVYS